MTKHSKISIFILLLFLSCLMASARNTAFASGGEEYITITVDAEDDNDNLMYAIDTTDPDAFKDSNTFTIPAGTSHTIYVRDAAGNITSQEYRPSPKPEESSTVIEESSDDHNDYDIYSEFESYSSDTDTQDINIDVEIGSKDYSSILGHASEPAQPGTGTTYDKTKTDGSDDGEKVFYTVTTAEGDTFYMVIDQTQNTDNVYLLNTVTRADLAALAEDDGTKTETDKKEDNLLAALQNEVSLSDTGTGTRETAKSREISPQIIVLIIVLIGGGAFYYLKVYKEKKDQQMDVMDAMDMEDFTPEHEEDNDEAEFEIADDEKQAFLDNLINGDDDEAFFDVDPDEYAKAESASDAENINLEDSLVSENDDAAITETEYIMQDIASQVADFESEYDPELDGEED